MKPTKFLTSSVVGDAAPPIAAVTLIQLNELTTLVFIESDGPLTKKDTVPICVITLTPKLLPVPPPILYCINMVVLALTVLPNAKLLEYLYKFKLYPSLANSRNCSSADCVPPPKVIFKNPSGVNSVINLSLVVTYLPTLIPGWSETLVGSSMNTLSSINALTSYHLLSAPKNSCDEGIFAY